MLPDIVARVSKTFRPNPMRRVRSLSLRQSIGFLDEYELANGEA
jgi:hypothetical protein